MLIISFHGISCGCFFCGPKVDGLQLMAQDDGALVCGALICIDLCIDLCTYLCTDLCTCVLICVLICVWVCVLICVLVY